MVILIHFICNRIINKSYLPNFIYIGVESSIKPFITKMKYGMKGLNLNNTRKMLFGSGRSNGFMFLIKILINSLTRQNYNFCLYIYEKECIVTCYPVPYIIYSSPYYRCMVSKPIVLMINLFITGILHMRDESEYILFLIKAVFCFSLLLFFSI